MSESVVITGLGTVTPLGYSPADLLGACISGRIAATSSGPKPLEHVRIARVADFDPGQWIPESKTIRMMSRDAQLAVAAAGLAIRDAGITVGETYPPHEVGIYGATGLAGIALEEVSKLIRTSAGDDGSLDLERFGSVALRQVRPVLSFKILANMPLCFASIALGIQGPNAIYNPWEMHGAQAITAGAQAIRLGRAKAVLVGGCDVKTHDLGLIALQQHGALGGASPLIGEGAVFVVLEREEDARRRDTRIYARLRCGNSGVAIEHRVLSSPSGEASGLSVHPKGHVGDLFAAAAAVQLACAAQWCDQLSAGVQAQCAGHRGQPVCFELEAA